MRYVLTGPESCGKSTLFDRLAPIFEGSTFPEYARIFAASKQAESSFSLEEVCHIATHQSNEMKTPGQKLMDTDLLTTLIWLEEKFDYQDVRLWEQLTSFEDALYYICSPDIPWEYDPLRENQFDRDRLFDKYVYYIQKFGFDYQILNGSIAERIFQIRHGKGAKVFYWP